VRVLILADREICKIFAARACECLEVWFHRWKNFQTVLMCCWYQNNKRFCLHFVFSAFQRLDQLCPTCGPHATQSRVLCSPV